MKMKNDRDRDTDLTTDGGRITTDGDGLLIGQAGNGGNLTTENV
ncbi:MAG: hypothetical protein JWR26_650 [Pedosphaera sp.]|nr:hypothetical protein [Pedosphaera sp.]